MTKDRVYVFFIVSYLAQGLVGIAYEPIYYLQKDELSLSVAQSAVFTAWMTAPFLLKPLLGLITDAFPIGGRRRLPYVGFAAASTAAGWATLALLPTYSHLPTLALLTAVNVGICFSDVLCDGIMVEEGKKENKTGKFQSAQIGALYLTLLVTGVGGGWLAQNASYGFVFALTAVFPLMILATLGSVSERPIQGPRPQTRLLAEALWSLARDGRFWAACLIILLYNFAPFKGTAWFYYQVDTLGFSKILIGSLTSVNGVSGVIGAGLFWKFYGGKPNILGKKRNLDTRTILRISVIAGVPLTLLYLFYRGPITAFVLTALLGGAGVMMRLGLMDLAARACPKHAEATAFAVFMSVFNLAAWSSNTAGAYAYASLSKEIGSHSAMAVLICAAAAAVAACWPLLDRSMSERT